MNITFLIGNGFDLNLGLKTTYHNFLDYYYLKNTDNDNENIKDFKKIIEEERAKGIDTWADAEISLGRVTKEFDDVDKFLDCFEDFCLKLSYYLENEQNKVNYELNKEVIIKNFEFIFYNLKFLIDSNYRQYFPYLIKDKANFNTFNFINLNYTNTLDNFLKMFSNISYIKIHNSLDEHMILGLADNSQIHNKEFLKNRTFDELLIKKSCDAYLGNNKYEIASGYIKNSDVIILYGVSLGETDKYLWQQIYSWLISNINNKLIIYNFGVENNKMKIRRHQKENEKRDEFLEICQSTNKDLESLRKRIYCIENNIFEGIKDIFKESNDCNINNEKSNVSNVS